MVDIPVPVVLFSSAGRSPSDGARLPEEDNSKQAL